MADKVKVTNISHLSKAGSIGAWIADKFLDPGTEVVIPISKLPEDWERLGTIFSFQFLEGIPADPVATPQQIAPVVDKQMLKDLLKEVVGEHLLANKAPEAPNPGITKQDLIDAISALSVQAPTGANQTQKYVDVASFVPEIKSAEEIQISMETSTTKMGSGSLSDLKKKLKKLGS